MLNLVQKSLDENDDLKNYLSQNHFLFIGLPTDPVEVNRFLPKEASTLILQLKCKLVHFFFFLYYTPLLEYETFKVSINLFAIMVHVIFF